MFSTKQEIQELHDTLGELDLWEYKNSKSKLIDLIVRHGLYNISLGQTPEVVLESYVNHLEEEEANNYRQRAI
tara:strand:- start:102 stop:320 length:219 start_codon:yes stop_codon:yes gene_type:complete